LPLLLTIGQIRNQYDDHDDKKKYEDYCCH
jgi:hypothetical protein